MFGEDSQLFKSLKEDERLEKLNIIIEKKNKNEINEKEGLKKSKSSKNNKESTFWEEKKISRHFLFKKWGHS